MLVLRAPVGCGVYYGLDLLLSKLSTAQSNGKFRERNTDRRRQTGETLSQTDIEKSKDKH